MLKKSLLRSAPALRAPCCAWVPARALLARAFAGTNPCGCALPAALGHRPKPSVAWAFAGTSVHRTLALFRLTHWTVVCFRLTPLRRQVRGSPSCATLSCCAWKTGADPPWSARSPGQGSSGPLASLWLTRGEPAQRDKASPELYLYPLRPWLFQLAAQKTRFLLCSIFQTLACSKNVRRIRAPR